MTNYQMPVLNEQERELVLDEAENLLSTLRPGSYGYHMAQVALAALTAEPVKWWTGPEPTPTGEIESIHDHETGSHCLRLICLDVIKQEGGAA